VAVREGTVVTVAQGLVAALDADMRRPWWDGIRGMWRGLNIMGIAPDLPWRPDLWSEPAPRAPYPAVADEERVIVAGLRGDVRAYALRSGELLWERRGAAISAAPVLTADGLLLAGRGSLTLLDPADGSELRRVELAGVTPLDLIVTQQATYLLTESGRLLALRP
jgi:outer membrane protein assembly factor BamB